MDTSAGSWWFTLVLTAFTSARLTRLITFDKITGRLRAWTIRVAKNPDKGLPVLFSCAWCMGVWVSTTVAAVAVAFRGQVWFVAPALALTASQITGMITASRE
jgi:hypothetical protein